MAQQVKFLVSPDYSGSIQFPASTARRAVENGPGNWALASTWKKIHGVLAFDFGLTCTWLLKPFGQ